MSTPKEWIEQHQRMVDLLPDVTAELKRIPGVINVEVGVKVAAGKATGELAFRVYVVHKGGDVPSGQRIPAEIRGFQTDVIQVSAPSLTAYEEKRRPVLGGIQIHTSFNSGPATLGCIARRNGDNALVLLSNDHVLMGGNPSGDIKVGQPRYSKSCCCECNVVGVVAAHQNDGSVDCAIATLNNGIGAQNLIRGLNSDGTDGGVNGSLNLAAPPVDAVVKVGKTSSRTTGTVLSITHSTPANTTAGIPARTNQILIQPSAGTTIFQNYGDSGSVLVNSSNQVIGLMWGAYLSNPADSLYGHGIACPIGPVLSALNISIPSGTLTTTAALTPVETTTPLFFETIEERLSETATGRSILQVVYQHLDEVLDLVNNRRPVTVVWRRKQGPAYLAAFARSAREPDYRIPERIEGASLHSLLLQMASVLEEEGSPALRTAVARYLPALLELLPGCRRVDDFLAQVERWPADGVNPSVVS